MAEKSGAKACDVRQWIRIDETAPPVPRARSKRVWRLDPDVDVQAAAPEGPDDCEGGWPLAIQHENAILSGWRQLGGHRWARGSQHRPASRERARGARRGSSAPISESDQYRADPDATVNSTARQEAPTHHCLRQGGVAVAVSVPVSVGGRKRVKSIERHRRRDSRATSQPVGKIASSTPLRITSRSCLNEARPLLQAVRRRDGTRADGVGRAAGGVRDLPVGAAASPISGSRRRSRFRPTRPCWRS